MNQIAWRQAQQLAARRRRLRCSNGNPGDHSRLRRNPGREVNSSIWIAARYAKEEHQVEGALFERDVRRISRRLILRQARRFSRESTDAMQLGATL